MGIQGLSHNVLGMQVSQAGLRVTNHNIANSATDNYSRKLLLQNTATTQDVTLKKIATGVKVEDVMRAKGLTNAFNSTHQSLDVIKESLNAKGNGELKKTIDLLNIQLAIGN